MTCGPRLWALGKKCCPDCTHGRTALCEGCGNVRGVEGICTLPDGGTLHRLGDECQHCGYGAIQ